METDNLYARAPLDLAVQHIRLVEIQPGDESETIQCKFHRFPLSECPEYIALSYTWGPPKVYKQILVDDAPFPLRRNLWWFLYYTRLQNQNQNQLFWIDAMCINQLNNQERNHQVRLMGQIYSMAKSVAVWLGEAQDDSDLAMDFVETKGLAPLKAKSGRFQPIWNWSQGKALLQLCERSYWSRVWVVQEIM
ncbi:HET-domain-containing protein, partial [Acephala macrosclerotiorum]